jgi:tetratricopeptide (TPR) repeat protein
VALDKNFWPAINNIGLIKYETGDADAAIRHWRSAVSVDAKAAEPLLATAVALYAKGDREQGIALGEAAIKLDSRYSDLKFLKENLWGERLLADTKKLLATPRIQATIAQAQERKIPSSQPQQPAQ